MRYAIIENGIVVNIAEAEAPLGAGWIADDGNARIGGSWDGSAFHPAPPPAVVVPASVTMRQARLALLGAGKLADVDAAIDMLPSPQKDAARIEWEYAAVVERTSPLIATLGPALGLSEAALDALFVQAATL